MDIRDLIHEAIALKTKLAQARKAAHPGYPAVMTPAGDRFHRIHHLEYLAQQRVTRRFLKLKASLKS
jgi:hypothetical protein